MDKLSAVQAELRIIERGIVDWAIRAYPYAESTKKWKAAKEEEKQLISQLGNLHDN